jgi:hypothetical protein
VVSVEEVGVVGGNRRGGGEEKRKEKKNWGRERKMEQERAKQIDIWTRQKRETGNNKLKKIKLKY